MAPIKLEDNMKERLEGRTIEPAMAAWDRISSKLDAEQGVKKSKRVLWMSIAASFLGGTLVALFLFQNMDSDTIPVLVNTNEKPVFIDPTEEIEKPQSNENINLQQIKEVIVQQETVNEQQLKADKQDLEIQKVTNPETVVVVKESENKKRVLQTEIQKETRIQNDVIVSVQKQETENSKSFKNDDELKKIISQKVEEVIAQVENKESVTDAEIEELLKNAQREIISKQIFNQETNTVDANALLLDVEAEIAPTSFRNKIFEALAEGYEKAKDAVVNRNN